jgi:hypothetical protein
MTDHQAAQHVYLHFAPRATTNGLALAGLILGIVAAVGALIPFLGMFLAALPALLAIIFGIVGVVTANRNHGLRARMAIAAIILGCTPLPIGLVIITAITSN